MRWRLGLAASPSALHLTVVPLDQQAAEVGQIWTRTEKRLCGRVIHQGDQTVCQDCVLRLSSLLLVSRLVMAGRIEVEGEEVCGDGEEVEAVPVRDGGSAVGSDRVVA